MICKKKKKKRDFFMKTRRQTYKKCGDMRRRRRRKGPFDEDRAETRRDEKNGQVRRGVASFG